MITSASGVELMRRNKCQICNTSSTETQPTQKTSKIISWEVLRNANSLIAANPVPQSETNRSHQVNEVARIPTAMIYRDETPPQSESRHKAANPRFFAPCVIVGRTPLSAIRLKS